MTTTTTTSPFFPVIAMNIWGAPGTAQYIGRPRVWEECGAQNLFTPPSYFRRSTGYDCDDFNISLSVQGTFAATVTLQRSFDDGVTWHDVETFTEPIEKFVINTDSSHKWRLGIKSGNYTSGEAFCQLSQ